jgi:PIN domain nuclease of toxin-antitoxin system
MILLDTCILLRLAAEETLPPQVAALLQRGPWIVSSITAWEISIKYSLGKLPLPQTPERWWAGAVEVFGLRVEPFTSQQAIRAGALPRLHADPFDRALIAVTLEKNYLMATIDPMMLEYQSCGLRLGE